SRLINNYLDETFTKLILVEKSLIKKDMPVTRESFKNELFGIHQNIQIRTLIPIFQDHNSRMKILVGQEFAKSTHKRYETSLKHTQDFLLWKFKASDIELEKIDHAFICDYEFYLRSVRKCGNNSAVKYIKNFKKIVRLCLANGWISLDPFANYKSKVKEVERVYLTQEELQKIMDKKIIGDRLGIVRDLFLFSCFTGLAYIDLKNLTPNHISKGIDGDLWIFTNRQKTESASKIPLLPIPKGIINKYQDHPQCEIQGKLLPVPSNQKMNAYLKEIADISQINKELTFHIARHTFATTVTLTNGVPIESVSKMLGHKNLRTTQHYAKVLDKKVSEDMNILRQKFQLKTATKAKKAQ
ncbi:MAG: site-specific integrase, partial [Bacteroidetes bacterium]|nr:site-specific integrase [Bacteroidota bacterium]